jgi:hypothetical protein
MEFLMVVEQEPARCLEDSRNCGQDFIVRCDDYWSSAHETAFAIVIYRPKTLEERLTADERPGAGQAVGLRVRRVTECDTSPYEDGSFGSDCDDWDCFPQCCRIFSPFEDAYDGREILLDELEPFGSLPCFKLEHDPFPTAGFEGPRSD